MTKCILCSNSSNKLSKCTIFNIDVNFCKKCQLYSLAKFPTKDYLDKYYSQEYFNELKKSKKMYFLKSLFSKIRSFSQYRYITNNSSAKTGKNLLEIGSSDGTFLYIFKKKSWIIKGLEYNNHMIKKAKEKYDIELEKKSIFDIDPRKNSFDVIALLHVLEHMLNPVEVLKHCKKLLKKEGLIFIELPHSPHPTEATKEELEEYLESTHIFNFNPLSLTKLINKSGLAVNTMNRFFYQTPWNVENNKIVGRTLMKAQISFNPLKAGIISFSTIDIILRFLLNLDPMKQINLDSPWQGLGDNLRVIVKNN